MIMTLRKQLKVWVSGVLVAQLFFMNVAPASAGLFSKPKVPSASSTMSDVEQRYHLDVGALQNQGEAMNTSENKMARPAVSIFFSPSDPREGEKLSAKAFPMYFSNTEQDLYYTWYLKRQNCGLSSSPSATVRALCDRDNDGRITVEDWKIEAALILARGGYDAVEAGETYTSESDNDGYKAPMGGGSKKGVANHCYYTDPANGQMYEIGTSGAIGFDCPNNKNGDSTKAICLIEEGTMDPVDISIPGDGGSDPMNPIPPTAGTSGPAFSFSGLGVCAVSGTPICRSGVAYCRVGTPRCVVDRYANPLTCDSEPIPTNSISPPITSCNDSGALIPVCDHLFPRGASSGDGSFGLAEEKVWGTNPNDDSTVDNGQKDEANVVGLGQSTFVWNYTKGDQVGVVVEGTSMIPTKYDDSSSMIMWAFSKNDCPMSMASGTGAFYQRIRGYDVEIPSIDIDLNDCLERNLVDPTQGGQATTLDVSVTATPETPINDASFYLEGGVPVAEGGGDTVLVEASTGNAARGETEVYYEWSVEMANNAQFSNGGGLVANVVTTELQNMKLLGNIKGVALSSLRLKLDILNNGSTLFSGRPLGDYVDPNGIGYLRFKVKASENFASGVARMGKSDVVVRFSSTEKKISAYKPLTRLVGSGMQVVLPNVATKPICNDDPLDRVSCRIVKNEVIGLRIDPTGLENFRWLINGSPLICNRSFVSSDCEDERQNHVNFFPVTGEEGDTYTVTVYANDIKTGKAVSLARTFHVITPALLLKSADLDVAWPKVLGQYQDIDGVGSVACPGGWCNDYSTSVLEGFTTAMLKIESDFIPDFIAATARRQWTVDGVLVDDTASLDPFGNTVFTIAFNALKEATDVYNISLSASVAQTQELRRALRDIWNISPLDSPETNFSASVQVQLREIGVNAKGGLPGKKQYFAALLSYVPSSVMFSFRVVLSALLLLFTLRFLLALLPERLESARLSRYRAR